MKIVAVMSMRNEVDIIETWVRYYAGKVDHIIITDNLSIDGSGDLVNKLINEGLPVSMEVDNRLGHLQTERVHKMMNRAFIEFQADWILLLDADEFLVPLPGKTFYDILEGLKDNRPLKLAWKTYIPTENDVDDLNVLKRVTYRLENEVNQYYKVMVPAKIGENPKTEIMMGNHSIRKGGKDIKAQDAPSGMFLAHFPVRSMRQVMTKIMVGWLTTLIRPEYAQGDCYHWKLMFDSFIKNEGEAYDNLQNMAVNYLGVTENGESPRLVNCPVDEMLLKYSINYFSDAQCRPFSMFARTAEDIATDYGRMAAEMVAVKSDYEKKDRNVLAFFKKFKNKKEV